MLGPDRAVRHRRRARAGGRGHRGHPPQRGGVVRPDPPRPRPVRLARRHRRRDRRGAGRRDRRRSRRGRPPPARGPLAGGAAVADPARRAHVAHVAAAVRARGPGRGRGAVRARGRGRPGPPPHRRPDRARSRWRSRSSCRSASRRTGWRSSARAPAARGWACDRSCRPTTYATMPPAGWSRGRHAVARPRGRRPADRRPDRGPAARGLRAAPTSSRRRCASTAGSRARSSCPAGRRVPWPASAQPDPRGRGGRGVRRARPRLLAARRGGPRHDRRADRPARTAATSTSTWGCWPSAAGPRTRSAC